MGGGTRYRPALSSRLEYCQEWVAFCHRENLSVKPQRRVARKNIDLYSEGLFKFQARPTSIDAAALSDAVSHVSRLLRTHVGMSRALSFEEAVDRVIAKTGMSAANARWNKYGETKRDVLENPEALEKIRVELHPSRLADVGLFTMSLKDELREVVDGVPKDARVFMPVDLTLLIATIMCYGDFNDRFVDASFDGSLGGSFLHGNADALVKRLLKHKFFGKGDAHKYDTTQNALLREVVYAIRDALTADSELRATVRACLCYPRFVLPNGQVWQVSGGNPSGSFNTLVDNSILTLLVLAYCMHRHYGFIDAELLEEIVTGDDYLYSTDDSEFTPAVVARFAAELGLWFDSEQLTGLDKADFCQRRFVLNGGRWVAVPVDAAKFMDTMLFNRCLNPFDVAVLSQSILIENFYISENRTILRKFQDFLRSEYLVDLEYLTDRQIDQLHKQEMVYECKLKVNPARFKRDHQKDLSCSQPLRLTLDAFATTYLDPIVDRLADQVNPHTWEDPFRNFVDQPDSGPAQSSFDRLFVPRAAQRAVRGLARIVGGAVAATTARRVYQDFTSLSLSEEAALDDPRFRPTPMPMRKIPVQKPGKLLVAGKNMKPGAQAARNALRRLARAGPAPRMQAQAVRAPVAMAVTNRASGGGVRANGNKMVISRREFIVDLSGSVDLSVRRVNIALATFPWAKSYSRLYETYSIKRCVFEYIPTVASSATGYIILAPDYDPTDIHTAAESKAKFTNMHGAKSGNAWTPVICPLDSESLQKQKVLYTDDGPETTGAQARQDRAGNLWVVTGGNAASVMGELWVSYVIELQTPQLNNPKSGLSDSVGGGGAVARYLGSSNAASFGSAVADGYIPATIASSGTTTSVTTFTFDQPWSGYVYIKLDGADLDSLAVTGTGDSAVVKNHDSNTQFSSFIWVDCDQDKTLIITFANTSVSAGAAYFMRSADVRP